MYEDQLNSLWSTQDFVLSQIASVTPEFLAEHKGIIEIELQVGRYLNMLDICHEIAANKIEGDVVDLADGKDWG